MLRNIFDIGIIKIQVNPLKLNMTRRKLRGEELFKKIDSTINNRSLYLNPHLTRKDICKLFNIDKNILCAVIKQYGDAVNFPEYINKKRMNYCAEKLVTAPDCPIKVIALESGFQSAISFNRVFKRFFKMTPTQYLETQKKLS